MAPQIWRYRAALLSYFYSGKYGVRATVMLNRVASLWRRLVQTLEVMLPSLHPGLGSLLEAAGAVEGQLNLNRRVLQQLLVQLHRRRTTWGFTSSGTPKLHAMMEQQLGETFSFFKHFFWMNGLRLTFCFSSSVHAAFTWRSPEETAGGFYFWRVSDHKSPVFQTRSYRIKPPGQDPDLKLDISFLLFLSFLKSGSFLYLVWNTQLLISKKKIWGISNQIWSPGLGINDSILPFFSILRTSVEYFKTLDQFDPENGNYYDSTSKKDLGLILSRFLLLTFWCVYFKKKENMWI